MTSSDEISTPSEMVVDCQAVAHQLQRAAVQVTRPAPSIHFDEFPRDIPKRDIEISEAAQRLANALHLHLD